MTDTRRNQLKAFVEREFIGPDPIDWEDTKQANGEEILITDAPSIGILQEFCSREWYQRK